MFRLALAILASLALMACSKGGGSKGCGNATIIEVDQSTSRAEGMTADNTVLIPRQDGNSRSVQTRMVLDSGRVIEMDEGSGNHTSGRGSDAIVDFKNHVMRMDDKEIRFTRTLRKGLSGQDVYQFDMTELEKELKKNIEGKDEHGMHFCSVSSVTTFSFNKDYSETDLTMTSKVRVQVSDSDLKELPPR
jgi:hypothetical protein